MIDGHNLAHHLFQLHIGQRLDAEIAGRLVSLLSAYRGQFTEPRPEFELCFDGGVRPELPDPAGVRVLSAGHLNKADYLVVDRYRTHAYFGHSCLVITNDDEILSRVKAEGGSTLLVFDFVRYPHPDNPILQSSEYLEAAFVPQGKKDKPQIAETETIVHRIRPIKLPKRKPKTPEPPIQTKMIQPEPLPLDPDPGSLRPAVPPEPEPHYRIVIPDWPVQEGMRFLMDSFCEKHRSEFTNLLDSFDPLQLRPADLQVLAEFLIAECGAETGFGTRGSLMNRVRLALLKAGKQGLSLSQLAFGTGLKPLGLAGRIRRKAKGWIDVISAQTNQG